MSVLSGNYVHLNILQYITIFNDMSDDIVSINYTYVGNKRIVPTALCDPKRGM